MASVTQVIRVVKQPRGGYIPVKDFRLEELDSNEVLNEAENIHSILMGLVVDYLSRFMINDDKQESFKISLLGARLGGFDKLSKSLLKKVKGLDDESIISACKLVGFDVIYRAGLMGYKPVELINPDVDTISNVRVMVKRSLEFFKKYGPITKDGFTFNKKSYTKRVTIADGDFLTKDTLWDFKVSKNKITSKHSLQLLMYYLMGKKSKEKHFKDINKIGVYNPRLNKVYLYTIKDLENSLIEEVEKKVIGY